VKAFRTNFRSTFRTGRSWSS